jgi:hypothetical protein
MQQGFKQAWCVHATPNTAFNVAYPRHGTYHIVMRGELRKMFKLGIEMVINSQEHVACV